MEVSPDDAAKFVMMRWNFLSLARKTSGDSASLNFLPFLYSSSSTTSSDPVKCLMSNVRDVCSLSLGMRELQ